MSDYFATPWTVTCQAPLSMGFSQARILEWVAIPFSRGSSWPRDQTHISCLAGKFFTTEPCGKPFFFFFFALVYYINEASHINWHCLIVIISMNGKKRCYVHQRKMPQETWVSSGMNARENSTLIMVLNKATSTVYFIKALVNVF